VNTGRFEPWQTSGASLPLVQYPGGFTVRERGSRNWVHVWGGSTAFPDGVSRSWGLFSCGRGSWGVTSWRAGGWLGGRCCSPFRSVVTGRVRRCWGSLAVGVQ
jgi:hypothetical protein